MGVPPKWIFWYTFWLFSYFLWHIPLPLMLPLHQTISHFQYANKWRSSVTCWRQGRPMNQVISLIVLEHGLIAVMHPISGMPYTSNIWIWWKEGNSRILLEQAPIIHRHNPACVPSPYISLTNLPWIACRRLGGYFTQACKRIGGINEHTHLNWQTVNVMQIYISIQYAANWELIH